MTNFATAAKIESTKKLTENGALAYSTTMNDLLDLFSCIGALRERTKNEIEQKYAKAFAQDKALATKMLFYVGDIRNGGLGERRAFRVCLRWLANKEPEIVINNIKNIPYYNRWDSLFVLIDTPCEDAMWGLIEATIFHDIMVLRKKEKDISLIGKWMPSCNTSSKTTKELAKKAIKKLGLTPRQYRKMLSGLRAAIDVTETKMSLGDWDKIKYEAVPSYAMKRYASAFARHDNDRFSEYIAALNRKDKTTKINASTLYPYDLVYDILYKNTDNLVCEQQWEALPNYVEGENNILIMADVSGSMCGIPMATSIGLAIYFAERNKGNFHNLYMSFSSNPQYISLNDTESLREKVFRVKRTDIGYSTNLELAFQKVLNTALCYDIDDLPKAICVITDMEIDNYSFHGGIDFIDEMKKQYSDHGYTMPKLILWNVNARNDTFLTQSEDVIKVSGQSFSIFKRLCGCLEGKTDVDFMLETLNDKAYDRVVLPS